MFVVQSVHIHSAAGILTEWCQSHIRINVIQYVMPV